MATRTISNAGGNWNATATWVEGVVPVAGDSVVATVTSGNLVVNVNSACQSLDFTNYVSTFSINSTLTMAGTGVITFAAAMIINGTGTISIGGSITKTITSNGAVFTGGLSITSGIVTISFVDNFYCLDLFINGTCSFVGGNNIYIARTLTLNNGTISNGSVFVMTASYTGIGTIAGSSISVTNGGEIRIDTIGIVNWSGATVRYNNGYINVVSGTFNHTGTTLNITGMRFNTPNTQWNTITTTATGTINIDSLLLVTTFTTNYTIASQVATFAGSAGFIATTMWLQNTVEAIQAQIKLVSGLTYIIFNLYAFRSTKALSNEISTTIASSPAYLILNPVGEHIVGYTNFTDIDAAGGQTIRTFEGVLTRINNIYKLTSDIGNVCYTF